MQEREEERETETDSSFVVTEQFSSVVFRVSSYLIWPLCLFQRILSRTAAINNNAVGYFENVTYHDAVPPSVLEYMCIYWNCS